MNNEIVIVLCAICCMFCNYEVKADFTEYNSGKLTKTTFSPKLTYVSQKLDNFNLTNNQTWLMRVQYNGEFFEAGGPIFIMIGGENPFVGNWLKEGQMYNMAKEHNAFMFYTEHRFYGYSLPNRSLSIENLKYLTPDQALADIINMIHFYKKTYTNMRDSKVVVFGGSYAGNLALWIREKYPNDIHAAVSSGAPLQAKFDFKEYHEAVQDILGSECSYAISQVIAQIVNTLGTPDGINKVQNDFNMCRNVDLNDPMEVMYLLSIISTHFGSVVQNNGADIHKSVCNEILLPASTDEYTRLVNYFNVVFGSKCKKGYNDFKNYISTTNSGNLRQWMYQSCFQFGFFQTTSGVNQPFGDGLPVEMYQTWCKDFFGSKFDITKSQIGITRTNLIYGGLKPLVTRVVSVQGTGDPWHKLGLKKDLNIDAPVIIVNGSYHCEDLKSLSCKDSEEMKNAKLLVQKYVRQWLKEN